MWYVYAIFEDENLNPFYIGKGKDYRKSATININNCDNFLKKNKIQKIYNSGKNPIVKILEEFENEKEAFILESQLIAQFGKIIDNTGCLTNLNDGGPSNTGWVPSYETRKLWSKQRAGYKQSEEHITKRSEQLKGKKRSKNQKQNISKAKILENAEKNRQIIKKIEEKGKYHGLFKKISEDYNVNINTVTRIYKNIEFYKEVLYGEQK